VAVEEVVNISNKVVPVMTGITKMDDEAKMDKVAEDSVEPALLTQNWPLD
jgi:hypothetical protein